MNKHLRNLIHKHRASMGLNFGQLAELSGFRNRSKWAIRICNFEREGVGDDEMVSKVIQALEIDHQEVRDAIQKDYAIWEQWANEPVPMQMLIRITGVIILIHDMPPEITVTGRGHRVCPELRQGKWSPSLSSFFRGENQYGSLRMATVSYPKQHQDNQMCRMRVWVERNFFLTVARIHSRLLY